MRISRFISSFTIMMVLIALTRAPTIQAAVDGPMQVPVPGGYLTNTPPAGCTVSKATFYEYLGYRGQRYTLAIGTNVSALPEAYDNTFSSLCVPPNATVYAFRNANYKYIGRLKIENTTKQYMVVPDLRKVGYTKHWDNSISALKSLKHDRSASQLIPWNGE